jgi:hypothetical protein
LSPNRRGEDPDLPASPYGSDPATASRLEVQGFAAPICEVDPATVPKAMDVITPPGVSQATELNPLAGPVVIQPVTVP